MKFDLCYVFWLENDKPRYIDHVIMFSVGMYILKYHDLYERWIERIINAGTRYSDSFWINTQSDNVNDVKYVVKKILNIYLR